MFRNIFTTLRALLKPGLCASQLCIRSDTASYRIRFQEIKIGSLEGFEKIKCFSLFLMRKQLSRGQKWFLRPNFPLIRGMFVFKSGPRFSSRALEVPEPRVRKRSFSLTKKDFGNLFFGFRIELESLKV